MTEYYHKKGNRIVKYAFLCAILNILEAHKLNRIEFEDNAFDQESDRLTFTSEGHKCRLVAIGKPDMEYCDLPLTVRTMWEGEYQDVDVTLNLSKIHIKTVENMCCEVYDWLRDENDDDWHDFRKQLVAGYLDTYLYS